MPTKDMKLPGGLETAWVSNSINLPSEHQWWNLDEEHIEPKSEKEKRKRRLPLGGTRGRIWYVLPGYLVNRRCLYLVSA